jgi:hypothetical protein
VEDWVAAEQHCKAAELMIRMIGGPQVLLASGFLERIVKWFAFNPEIVQGGPLWKDAWRALESFVADHKPQAS